CGPPLLLLFADKPATCGKACGHSAFVVYRSKSIEGAVNAIGSLLSVVLLAAVVVVLVRRWRRATDALRRVLPPVCLAPRATLVLLLLSNLVATVSTHLGTVLGPLFFLAFATIPFAFLYGILRSRLAQGSVAKLAVAVAEREPLRDAIADTLGD